MLLRTRWSKILKDIWGNRSRSLLVILSIAVGVAAVGMINTAARTIQRQLNQAYADGNPSLLEVYVSPFPKDLADAVEGMREIENAQARRVVAASLLRGNGSAEDLELIALPNYKDVKVNRFTLESGSMDPGVREILLERKSAEALGLSTGDMVQVEMGNERRYDLKVAGIVHDVYVRPFLLMGEATGYVSMDTLQWMGEAPYYDRLEIVVAENKYDKQHVLDMGNLARDRVIEPAGYQVARIQIPGIGSNPGEHWAHNQINGFLLILQIMGIIAVLLSGGLVINTVSAIISQQIKQIGIMRSVGARRHQIIGMYLFNVLIFSLMGLVIAIPLGMLGAWWLVGFASNFLNFDVPLVTLPPDVLALQVGLGLLMPVGVALFPIIAGTRIPVYDAIYQYGLNSEKESGKLESLLAKIRSLSPHVTLSLRNTFRKKSRLAFTLVTLILAGAMFMAVFSTRASLTAQIRQVGRYIAYDAALSIPGGANKRTVLREALRIPGVTVAEGWAHATGIIANPGQPESEEMEIVGLPYNTATMDPLLLEGSWLQGDGSNQVVVNDDLIEQQPDIHVGSRLVLKVGERKQAFQVAGIVSKHLSGPRIYMDESAFGKLTGEYNLVDMVRVRLDPARLSSPAQQDALAKQLGERFKNAGLSTSSSSTQHTFFGKFTDVFDIILIVLIIMAGLLAVVGGLGLTGSMGINVLERTREIGVLRAVGASNFTVRQVVVIEGVVVGVLSWMVSALLSAPAGMALSAAVILAVLKTAPNFQYSFSGLFIWLAIVVLIGVLASLTPAQRAVLLRVREVLDYE